MRKTLLPLLLALMTLTTCAPGPRITLDQVQTRRTIAAEKSVLMDCVRIYAMKELFKISSLEEETGRILGFRNTTGVRKDDPRTLLMQVSIVSTGPAVCDVNVRFVYSGNPASLSRDEESTLVECYSTLFDALEAKAKAK
jgi:hypothetical protein